MWNPSYKKKLGRAIQRKLLELKRKEYKQVYPSDSQTPIAYPLIKAHKPQKNYPARNIIFHHGSSQKSLASYLIPLITPLIEHSSLRCSNSKDFVDSLKDISIGEDEYTVSFDAVTTGHSVKQTLQKQAIFMSNNLN